MKDIKHAQIPEDIRTECLKALSIAKINILKKDKVTFLVALLLRMEIQLTLEIPTLATDGKKILVNPNFYLKQNKDWCIFILLHEVLHVAYDHCSRLEDRNHKKWNMACDYVINLDLKQVGFSIPPCALYDFQYQGMSAEQVYDLLDDDDCDNANNLLEDLIPGIGNSTEEQKQAYKQEIESMLLDAATQAEMSNDAGSIPPNVQRILENIRKPKVNWQIILRRFCNDLAKTTHTWKRPNRRMLPMYLPTIEGNKLSELLFAVDVSGSISNETFHRFCGEVGHVLKILKPNKLNLLQFDHDIEDVTPIKKVKDLFKVTFMGGGGTYLEPVMQYYINSKSKAMIVLTDGHFSNNITDPCKPIIWVVWDNPNWHPPFGNVVHFSL